MASTSTAFQPNDYGIGVVVDTAIGSAILNTTQLFTDSVSMPSFAPVQDLSVRSGDFVADSDDVFSSMYNTPTEITATGLLNDTVLGLLEGIFHTAASTNVITVTDAYTPPLLAHGENTAAASRTYTVKLLGPSMTENDASAGVNTSIALTGCSITALSIFGDAGTDGGRLKYSVTFKTGYTPDMVVAAGTTTAPVVTGFQTIHDLTYRTIAGVVNPVMTSFNLSIENPAEYVGWDPVNNVPYSISRSVPEGPSMTFASTIKADKGGNALLDTFMHASAQTSLVNHLSNDSDQPADLLTSGGATNWGFSCTKAIITGMSFNEQAAMMYNIDQKLLFGSFVIRNT